SVVEPRPSVIESPSVTTPLLEASARTSTPVMMYQWAVLAAPDMSRAVTALVARMNEVVREPGWPLMVVADTFPKEMLTARLVRAGRSKSQGSERIVFPRAIFTEGAPSKVSPLSVAGLISPVPTLPPPADNAMWAELIETEFVP